MLDESQWHEQLVSDLERLHAEDPRFRVCIVTQSSSKAVALESELHAPHPHLVVRKLVGTDSGETKRECLEDINETLSEVKCLFSAPSSSLASTSL